MKLSVKSLSHVPRGNLSHGPGNLEDLEGAPRTLTYTRALTHTHMYVCTHARMHAYGAYGMFVTVTHRL